MKEWNSETTRKVSWKEFCYRENTGKDLKISERKLSYRGGPKEGGFREAVSLGLSTGPVAETGPRPRLFVQRLANSRSISEAHRDAPPSVRFLHPSREVVAHASWTRIQLGPGSCLKPAIHPWFVCSLLSLAVCWQFTMAAAAAVDLAAVAGVGP